MATGISNDALEFIKKLIDERKLRKALSAINTEKEKEGEESFQVQLMILESQVRRYKGEYEKGLTVARAAEILASDSGDSVPLFHSSMEQIYNLIQLNEYADALKRLSTIDEMSNQYPKDFLIQVKSQVLNAKGIIYRKQGNFEEALNLHQQSLEYRRESGENQEIATALNNLAVLFRTKGDFESALEAHQESLLIRREIGKPPDIAVSLNNLGILYHEMGQLDLALETQMESLKLNKKIRNRTHSAVVHNNIAEIFRDRQEWDQAIEQYSQALKIENKDGNITAAVKIQFALFQIYLNQQNLALAEETLRDMYAQIEIDEKNRTVSILHRLAHIQLLITNKDVKERIQALMMLEGMLQEDFPNQSHRVQALKFYCALLQTKLKFYANLEVLVKAKKQTDNLQMQAISQNAFHLLVETWILQAKFAMIDGDYDSARTLLEQAETTAKEKGLKRLETQVKLEKYGFDVKFSKLTELVDKFKSSQDQVEQPRLVDYIKKSKSSMFDDDHLTSEMINELLDEELAAFEHDDMLVAKEQTYLEKINKLEKQVVQYQNEIIQLKKDNASLKEELSQLREEYETPPQAPAIKVSKSIPQVKPLKPVKKTVKPKLIKTIQSIILEVKSIHLRPLAMRVGISPIQCSEALKKLEKKNVISFQYAHEEDSNPIIVLA
jgi:tetratricopeptide (TPR) repeat protein